PDVVRTREGIQRVIEVLEIINSIESGFNPASANTPSGWPVLQRITGYANLYHKRQWSSPAAYLDALIKAVRPGEGTRIALSVDKILAADSILEDIERRWETIDDILNSNIGIPEQLVADNLSRIRDVRVDSLDGLSKNLLVRIEDFERLLAGTIKQPDKWLPVIRQFQFGSITLNNEWEKQRQDLLGPITEKDLLEDQSLYLQVKGRIETVQNFLVTLDDKEHLPYGLEVDQSPFLQSEWVDVLEAKLHRERERLLQQALEDTQWRDGTPQMQHPEQWQKTCNDYKSMWRGASDLLVDYSEINRYLSLFYLPDDQLEDRDETVRGLYNKWSGHTLLRDKEVSPAFALVNDRMERLIRILAETRREVLNQWRGELQEPIYLCALWRRLGMLTDPSWPQNQKEWDIDEHLRGELVRSYNEIEDKGRKDELLKDIHHQGQLRRETYVVAQIRENLQVIDTYAQQADDAVLAGFRDFADSQMHSDLDMEQKLSKLESMLALSVKLKMFLESDWQNRVDQLLFLKDSENHKNIQGDITAATYYAWLAEAGGYIRLGDDPRRQRSQWEEQGVQLRELLQILEKMDPQKSDQFSRQVSSWDEAVARMWDIPAIEKNRVLVEEQVTEYQNQLQQLQQQIHSSIETPADWFARITQTDSISSSAVLNKVWIARRGALLANITVAKLEGDMSTYSRLRTNVENVRTFLMGLDDEEYLPRTIEAVAIADKYRQPVIRFCADRREICLQKAVDSIKWDDNLPAVSLMDYKASSEWGGVTSRFRQRIQSVMDLVRDYMDIEAHLDLGYSLDETWPGTGRSVALLEGQWARQEEFDDMKAVFNEITQRLDSLKRLAEQNNKDELVRLAESMVTSSSALPERVVSLWRKMGQIPEWPAGLAELGLELKMLKLVQRILDEMPDADRRQFLSGQLAQESPRRWERCFNGLTQAADIEAAFDLLDSFGVDRERLSPRIHYNLLVYLLKKTANEASDDARLTEAIHIFQGQAENLSESLPRYEQVALLLNDLSELASESESRNSQIDWSEVGPGSDRAGAGIDWKVTFSDDYQKVSYHWPQKNHTISFVMLQPPVAGEPPFYLGVEEISLGLFSDVIESAGKFQEIKSLMPRAGKGPCVWQYGRNRVERNREWVQVKGLAKNESYYPGEIEPAPPGEDDPMQYISPDTALYFAGLLGCRLPSSSEWSYAYKLVRESSPSPVFNLRDRTWQRQQEHVRSLYEQKYPPQVDWPDTGIFCPISIDTGHKRDAEPVTSQDDGTIWFAPVDSAVEGGREYPFIHLVGNVAEFTYDDSELLDQFLMKTNPVTAEGIQMFLNNHSEPLNVIGASALSPKPIAIDKPYPTSPALAYSDVGFRLAFKAPYIPLGEQVKKLLENAYRID
ncbi:MAG: SUMF1/EgtB/PvdO family nonheme iron enzyme, partial [Sedimentisphaerales bacterium]|nr:SUMF1/EgtB/PvdO family nonheme iron enzyme [Sedimentisphaerales bacterium]